MREATELRRIFHEAARDQPNYLASTDAGNRAVYDLGRADERNKGWRDVAKEEAPRGHCVEVWGDDGGNVHLAVLAEDGWLAWSPFQDDRGDEPLPFAPTHWRRLRDGEPPTL
jgi:hypothetical protein